jgi:hypothetical protein
MAPIIKQTDQLRRPPTCPKHPLHSLPCPMCAGACKSCGAIGFVPKKGKTAAGLSFEGCAFCCNDEGEDITRR